MKKPIPVIFESNGANIHAIFYQASGVEPLPTVILCHGFPGNNTDVLGLGERLMEEGFSAFAFNYRGTWESEGLFTISNSLEDVVSAIRYVTSSVGIREFDVDPSNITVIGHSYGGSIALLGSLNYPAVRRVACTFGANPSEVGRMMQESDEFKREVLIGFDQDISDSGIRSPKAEELFAEVFADMDKYDLVRHAEALSTKDILLIGGWRDQWCPIEHHILPLYRALLKHGAKQVQIEMFDVGHSFADIKSQVADRIVSWLTSRQEIDVNARHSL